MKSKANKKKLKIEFAEIFVKAAYGYDPADPHSIPKAVQDYVDDVCNGGVPNALESFECLVELVNSLDHTQTQANVIEALYDYDIWNLYEFSLTDQELAFVQLKHSKFIEEIRNDDAGFLLSQEDVAALRLRCQGVESS